MIGLIGTNPGLPNFIKNWEPAFFLEMAIFYEISACLNLDAESVPEALVYSILHHFAQGVRIKHP